MNVRTADRVCHDCGSKYTVSQFFRKGDVVELIVEPEIFYEQDPPLGTLAFCPDCGCDDYTEIMPNPLPIGLGDVGGVGRFYPRFDKGLGRYVCSEAHRNQLCEKLGVLPTEGADLDIEGVTRRHDEERMDKIRRWYDLLDEYKSQEDTAKALDELAEKNQKRAKEAFDGQAEARTGYDPSTVVVVDEDGRGHLEQRG